MRRNTLSMVKGYWARKNTVLLLEIGKGIAKGKKLRLICVKAVDRLGAIETLVRDYKGTYKGNKVIFDNGAEIAICMPNQEGLK